MYILYMQMKHVVRRGERLRETLFLFFMSLFLPPKWGGKNERNIIFTYKSFHVAEIPPSNNVTSAITLQVMWCQITKVAVLWKTELVGKLVNYVT
jgi:hypothetical protein